MANQYAELNLELTEFIQQQHMYFVATADTEGRVNVSPKGLDSLKIVNSKQVIWLNLTGSGNETAAHVQSQPRMTIMFHDVVDKPLILRLYGQAEVIHKQDAEWQKYYALFADYIGARQIFVLNIDLVQTSCGMGVPLYDFKQQRDVLNKSAERKGIDGIKAYWAKKNQTSIDGKPTNIISKNLEQK